jgi:hypothetical protein
VRAGAALMRARARAADLTAELEQTLETFRSAMTECALTACGAPPAPATRLSAQLP